MADISADISDLWWLRNNEVQPGRFNSGLQAGAQLAQQRAALGVRKMELANEQIREQSLFMDKLAKQNGETMKLKGMSEMSQLLSRISVKGDWDNPDNEREFWNIAATYPQALDDATVNAIYTNTFEAARRRKEKVDLLKAPIEEVEIDGEKFFRQPGTGTLTRVHPSGQTIEAYGPDGQLLSRVTSGRGAQKDPNAPTIATQTDVQKQALAGESAVTTGITLLNSLSPDMVGARGFFNEVVINEGLAQIFPEKAKDEVSSGRSLMRAFNERVIKSIKADSQLNASERKALESALPQFGVGESLPSAKAKIGTFIEEARKVTRINSVRTNKPIPDWAWTREEVISKFKNKEIPEEKARELLKTYHYKLE